MSKLIVTVQKLNKRNSIPINLPDSNNIIGVVYKGFAFDGIEILPVPNPALGKWYRDMDGSYYWGGGLIIESSGNSNINLPGIPINLPPNYHLGVDVSHHNLNPDWNTIKNTGVSFAFIKISEGVGTPDPKTKENADNAKSIGLKIGYYHFCRPDTRNGGTVISDAEAEATEVLNRLKNVPSPDLPLVLDLEDQQNWDTHLEPDDYLKWITTFLNKIKQNTNKDSILYSRKEYLDRKLPHNHNLGQCKIWISYYPAHGDCNKVPCPIGWNDWSIWQYTEKGVIGANSKLDINILKDNTLF